MGEKRIRKEEGIEGSSDKGKGTRARKDLRRGLVSQYQMVFSLHEMSLQRNDV